MNGDRKYIYNLTVQASDDEFTATLPLTVTVSNVDETPEISGETEGDTNYPHFQHAENDASPVHRLTAPDPEGTAVSWTLEGADKDVFSIGGGVLEFSTPPNYEQPGDAGGKQRL